MRTRKINLLPILLLLFLFAACSKQEEDKSAMQAPQADSSTTTEMPDSSQPADEPVEEQKPSDVMQSPATQTAAPEDTASPATTVSAEQKTEGVKDEQQNQLSLARKSGCLACHAVDKKLVGPAWRDVSKRYKDNADAKSRLIEKVKKGGRGNWTDVVGTAAMPPYSPRVSDENIAQLVEFVLSLEK